MLLKQAELYWGLDHEFVKKVMDQTTKAAYDAQAVIFREGETANQFYTLIKGYVGLRIGEGGRMVFTINHAGESFGWSSLVGRDQYSATAVCHEPTTVSIISREAFWKIIKQNPAEGLVFMQRLAGLLGKRLLRSYELLDRSEAEDKQRSFGTGQVLEVLSEE